MITTWVDSPGCFVCEEEYLSIVLERKVCLHFFTVISSWGNPHQIKDTAKDNWNFRSPLILFTYLKNLWNLVAEVPQLSKFGCFGCYSLEANVLLWFILDMTHFLHFQALVWWLVGDCSASLKMHDISLLVFFFSCWKIFYSFLRRKEFSKWRPISKRYPV